MDIQHHLNGTDFVWNDRKAARNPEARDAVIGFDNSGHLLFVVHVQFEDAFIRIIPARKASNDERRDHEHF